VYVTLGDVERIQQFTGHCDFHEYRAPVDSIYLHDDGDIVWRSHVFRDDGSRRVLKQQANGDCLFLGSQGCTLTAEVRPLVCRIYPYDFNHQGIRDEPARGCPVELLPGRQSVFVALRMDYHDAVRWHKQLYEEITLELEPTRIER
jgi:Fe-S-cluster containining protein